MSHMQEANAADVSAPPFPLAVKVAAVHCLVQLAKHPALAAAISGAEAVRKLILSAAPAANGMTGEDAAQAGKAPQASAAGAAPSAPQAPAAGPAGVPAEPLDGPMAETIATLLQLLVTSSREKGPAVAEHRELVACVKGLAEVAQARGSAVACSNVVRTALLLSESDLVAPARPPPPSPPRTPPPLPLATSQFVWDALGRPNMTDGSNVKLVHL